MLLPLDPSAFSAPTADATLALLCFSLTSSSLSLPVGVARRPEEAEERVEVEGEEEEGEEPSRGAEERVPFVRLETPIWSERKKKEGRKEGKKGGEEGKEGKRRRGRRGRKGRKRRKLGRVVRRASSRIHNNTIDRPALPAAELSA